MRVEEIEAKSIYGVTTRTKNTNEMDPKTAKIAKVWQEFDAKVDVDYKGGERVYGVYYDYESDASGDFNVLAGYATVNEHLTSVTIEKGSYLVFSKSFESTDGQTRINAIISTWGEIWNYFSDTDSEFKRAFITDFEYYKGANEIEIYISIKA